jgi:hypothetical protein
MMMTVPQVEDTALANIAAIAKTEKSATTYLKYGKSGVFTAGVNQDPVESSEAFVALVHEAELGSVLFSPQGSFVDEITRPISEGRPITSADRPDHGPSAGEWRDQMTLTLLHVPDMNRYIFKTTSQGGMKAIKTLLGDFAARMKTGKRGLPIIHLVPDSYKHAKYGRINIPTFEIAGWTDEAANDEAVEGEVIKAKKESVLG